MHLSRGWFGGKRRVARLVWSRLGAVKNSVEPFYGSGAVLLGRPAPFDGVETINDLDGFVANFWRAIKLRPDEVAEHADRPVNENDLHAIHSWLVARREELRPQLEGDPEWCDPKIAGWWVWGTCCWIGSGFCSGRGPWQVVDGKLVHLGDNGRGVNRQLVHLGNGRGGRFIDWFGALSERLRDVRVCSGDWSRVCGPSVTFNHGLTGIFFDPPYADTATRTDDLYAVDSLDVAHKVREYCLANGDNPLMRIALAGYEGEHQMPDTWECVPWKSPGGFGGQAKERTENEMRERIWFSPHCLHPVKKLW